MSSAADSSRASGRQERAGVATETRPQVGVEDQPVGDVPRHEPAGRRMIEVRQGRRQGSDQRADRPQSGRRDHLVVIERDARQVGHQAGAVRLAIEVDHRHQPAVDARTHAGDRQPWCPLLEVDQRAGVEFDRRGRFAGTRDLEHELAAVVHGEQGVVRTFAAEPLHHAGEPVTFGGDRGDLVARRCRRVETEQLHAESGVARLRCRRGVRKRRHRR